VASRSLPLRNCYWVLPGQVLAGEHPGGGTRQQTRERLKRLLDAGIQSFVDLTHPSERPSYDTELPSSIEYVRKPIEDHGVPPDREYMVEILDCVGDAMDSGRPVYVHCRAGIGRTGLVIGCLLAERGLSGEAALDEINRLWQQCERSQSWPSIPETREQVEFVRRWNRYAGPSSEDDPLFDSATLTAMRGLRSRFLGAMLGLATGDAVAAATQYRRPGSFAPVGDMLGGGPFDLPRGGWSDDTAMALCLAESLLECNGFNAQDQINRYRLWQREGYLSATGQCVGITASAARVLALGLPARPAASSDDSSELDPEPLSRIAPVTLFEFASADLAAQWAGDCSLTTCQAPAVLNACRTLARALHAALSGQPKQAILACAPQVAPTMVAPASGTAPEVLEAALWAFASTDTFRDALLRAANVGGNSDVVATVCGQLAGAHYGVAAIPRTWRNDLIHKDLLESYADRLLAHALLGLGS